MIVPFLELLPTYHELKPEIDDAVSRALNSGWYIGGETVHAFEQEFAAHCKFSECVTVGNGLDALKVALLASGLRRGDKVLVPSHTFIASWLAVTSIGCIPVPVDIEPGKYLVSHDSFINQLDCDVKAVVPVLLYGESYDYRPLINECSDRGIAVIIDAAQAHGARVLQGSDVNNCPHCWSFYPGKNLGAFGDGGAITSNDGEFIANARKIANYGSTVKYVHDVLGVNSRLDPIQCSILSVKLRHLDDWNTRRKGIASLYNSNLKSVGIPLLSEQTISHSYHLYVIETDNRDGLRTHLQQRGVGTQIHYPIPVHKQTAYSEYSEVSLPNTEYIARRILSLPLGPHISVEQAEYVVESVNSFGMRK
jgi:dTDP-4-amino-4,6-dideoxygalactose transaminase